MKYVIKGLTRAEALRMYCNAIDYMRDFDGAEGTYKVWAINGDMTFLSERAKTLGIDTNRGQK